MSPKTRDLTILMVIDLPFWTKERQLTCSLLKVPAYFSQKKFILFLILLNDITQNLITC